MAGPTDTAVAVSRHAARHDVAGARKPLRQPIRVTEYAEETTVPDFIAAAERDGRLLVEGVRRALLLEEKTTPCISRKKTTIAGTVIRGAMKRSRHRRDGLPQRGDRQYEKTFDIEHVWLVSRVSTPDSLQVYTTRYQCGVSDNKPSPLSLKREHCCSTSGDEEEPWQSYMG